LFPILWVKLLMNLIHGTPCNTKLERIQKCMFQLKYSCRGSGVAGMTSATSEKNGVNKTPDLRVGLPAGQTREGVLLMPGAVGVPAAPLTR
jgi:hypothetical protein